MNQNIFEEFGEGVIRIKSGVKGPEEIEYNGIPYFRFMDCLYTQNKNLDELDHAQVSSLCRARAMHPELINHANLEVRTHFKKLVNVLQPDSLLEIGAGPDPVFGAEDDKPVRYILADADITIIKQHTDLGSECYEFSTTVCKLPESDKYLQMAIAVFVMHFAFSTSQLSELYRRLNSTGIMVANVYRRTLASREILTRHIKEAGFEIIKLKDPIPLCRDHEYWIFGKNDAQLQTCADALKKIILDKILP